MSKYLSWGVWALDLLSKMVNVRKKAAAEENCSNNSHREKILGWKFLLKEREKVMRGESRARS